MVFRVDTAGRARRAQPFGLHDFSAIAAFWAVLGPDQIRLSARFGIFYLDGRGRKHLPCPGIPHLESGIVLAPSQPAILRHNKQPATAAP